MSLQPATSTVQTQSQLRGCRDAETGVSLNGKLQITEDMNDPHDRLKRLKKQHKDNNPKALSDKEKVALFDAYVDAGVITL